MGFAAKIKDFYRVSAPSPGKLSSGEVPGRYKRLRLQAFVAATVGYSLYYVCRTSLNVLLEDQRISQSDCLSKDGFMWLEESMKKYALKLMSFRSPVKPSFIKACF